MDIIHAQICIAKFFEWKQKQKDKQIAMAKKMFNTALKKDLAAERRRTMLLQIN